MNTSSLIRWSGLSAMASGVLNVLDSVFQPLPWLTSFSAVMTVFALIGIYAVQAEASGRLGFAGYLLGTAGYVLMAGGSSTIGSLPIYFLGAGLGAVGLVLLALGSLAARVFPRWVPALWIAAVIVGLPSLLLPWLTALLGILGGLAAGLGLAGAGYMLWSSRATQTAAPASAGIG
jgi:drug/metabolite transporter (DMT)-like permease